MCFVVLIVCYYLQEITELTDSLEEVVSPDITELVCILLAVNLSLAPSKITSNNQNSTARAPKDLLPQSTKVTV